MRDTLRHGSRGTDVRVLQTMLNALGDNLLVDGIFGDDTFNSVCDFQTVKKLEPDGIVGPKTWAAIDMAMARRMREVSIPPKPKTDADLELAGRKAIERAVVLWTHDIYDPARSDDSALARLSKQQIDTMIRFGLGWTWEPPYAGDGDFEWCGAFAATCWGEAIKPELRKLYFASTYRLDRYGSYRPAFGEENKGSGRLWQQIDGGELQRAPRAGDIALIGNKGYGHHIALIEKYEDGRIYTIEGNATGDGPNGEKQQGVVRRRRPLSTVRRIIRPSVEDLAC